MTPTERKRLQRERERQGLVLLSIWVPSAVHDACIAAVQNVVAKSQEARPNGRWVRNDDLHPMVNVWGRKWRAVGLYTETTGTYRGDDGAPLPDMRNVEWFFPSDDALNKHEGEGR
jgi:hypothetical protein